MDSWTLLGICRYSCGLIPFPWGSFKLYNTPDRLYYYLYLKHPFPAPYQRKDHVYSQAQICQSQIIFAWQRKFERKKNSCQKRNIKTPEANLSFFPEAAVIHLILPYLHDYMFPRLGEKLQILLKNIWRKFSELCSLFRLRIPSSVPLSHTHTFIARQPFMYIFSNSYLSSLSYIKWAYPLTVLLHNYF